MSFSYCRSIRTGNQLDDCNVLLAGRHGLTRMPRSFASNYSVDMYSHSGIVIAMEITVAEAAKRLRVSPRRVRRLVEDGRIEARRITATFMLIDEKELAKPNVKIRKPGRPWPKRKAK